jgi:hypothetical protein
MPAPKQTRPIAVRLPWGAVGNASRPNLQEYRPGDGPSLRALWFEYSGIIVAKIRCRQSVILHWPIFSPQYSDFCPAPGIKKRLDIARG